MPHNISPPSYPTPPPSPSSLPSTSRFNCLQVRLLYEKCGHTETLVIHELPCAKPYRTWLPETSPYVQVKACPNMSRHLAIKKAPCARCSVPTLAPVVKRGFLGWGGKGGDGNVSGNGDGNGRMGGDVLPIREIVRRRGEWLREIGRQEERKQRRVMEIEKLKKIRDL